MMLSKVMLCKGSRGGEVGDGMFFVVNIMLRFRQKCHGIKTELEPVI